MTALPARENDNLQVHPNTLRYRLKRAEDLLDINLGEPAGRLLVAFSWRYSAAPSAELLT